MGGTKFSEILNLEIFFPALKMGKYYTVLKFYFFLYYEDGRRLIFSTENVFLRYQKIYIDDDNFNDRCSVKGVNV